MRKEEEIRNYKARSSSFEEKTWWNPFDLSKRGSSVESTWIRGKRKINVREFTFL